MANKAISELPQAQNVNNQDLFVLEQGGLTKKLPAETFITEQGIIDALAEALDGHGGISSVTLSSVSGRIRTYRITFTDQSATTFQVYDGTSIDRISRTSSSGLDDVYTIFLSDGTTTFFTVHNGADGTVSEEMLNDALKDKAPVITETTESSAIANFTDGADDMVMHNVVAEINPVQSGSGDPSPSNIRPITGWTGCNVTRTGKNLFDKTTQAKNWYATSSNTIGNGGTLCLFSVPVGTTITVSGTNGSRNRLLYTDKDISDIAVGDQLTFLSNTNLPFTITTGHKTYAYYMETSFNQALVDSLQLELGSTATTYEPYQGNTVTVDWQTEAGTVYGGTVDVATGLLTVDRAIVTLGGGLQWLTWGVNNRTQGITGFYLYRSANSSVDYSNYRLATLTNILPINSLAWGGNAVGYYSNLQASVERDWYEMLGVSNDSVGIVDTDTNEQALSKFNAFLTATPLQVVHMLATPQTYQLTPQEVLHTLYGVNNVWADTGNVSVTYPADTKMFIEPTQLLQDNNLAYVESSSSASRAYAVNDLFVNRDGLLCKVTATVSSGGTLIEGTNYTILSGNGGLGAEVTSVLNGKEDAGWLTGMGFSRTDVSGSGYVSIRDYTIFLTKLISVSGTSIQSIVNAHYKVTFYLKNSNGGSFSLSGNCAGNTYNLSSDPSGLVSGTYEGDVSANGTIYNGSVGGSVGSGSIFAATVLVKF